MQCVVCPKCTHSHNHGAFFLCWNSWKICEIKKIYENYRIKASKCPFCVLPFHSSLSPYAINSSAVNPQGTVSFLEAPVSLGLTMILRVALLFEFSLTSPPQGVLRLLIQKFSCFLLGKTGKLFRILAIELREE